LPESLRRVLVAIRNISQDAERRAMGECRAILKLFGIPEYLLSAASRATFCPNSDRVQKLLTRSTCFLALRSLPMI
jgi:hypothetical protein